MCTHICLSSLAVELSSCHMQMHVLSLCVLVCVCADVFRLMSCQYNKGFRRVKWRGGQPGDWQSRESLIQSLCHNESVVLGPRMASMLHYILTLNFQIQHSCALGLTHFAYARSKPDLGWCHVQLLQGWQTVSAPQHGALWSSCQADRQVNDTNENQPFLPQGAKNTEWQPVSSQTVSLNLKVISSSHTFTSFALCVTLPFWPLFPLHLLLFIFLFSTKTSFSFASLALFSPPLKAPAFFLCLSSSLFLSLTLSVTALLCVLSPCHQVFRGSLTASQLCLSSQKWDKKCVISQSNRHRVVEAQMLLGGNPTTLVQPCFASLDSHHVLVNFSPKKLKIGL